LNCWTRSASDNDDNGDEVVTSDETRLIRILTKRYEKIGRIARPVKNSSTPIKVLLSVMLYQLINVDESEQFITVKLWIHMVGWTRYRRAQSDYLFPKYFAFSSDAITHSVRRSDAHQQRRQSLQCSLKSSLKQSTDGTQTTVIVIQLF